MLPRPPVSRAGPRARPSHRCSLGHPCPPWRDAPRRRYGRPVRVLRRPGPRRAAPAAGYAGAAPRAPLPPPATPGGQHGETCLEPARRAAYSSEREIGRAPPSTTTAASARAPGAACRLGTARPSVSDSASAPVGPVSSRVSTSTWSAATSNVRGIESDTSCSSRRTAASGESTTTSTTARSGVAPGYVPPATAAAALSVPEAGGSDAARSTGQMPLPRGRARPRRAPARGAARGRARWRAPRPRPGPPRPSRPARCRAAAPRRAAPRAGAAERRLDRGPPGRAGGTDDDGEPVLLCELQQPVGDELLGLGDLGQGQRGRAPPLDLDHRAGPRSLPDRLRVDAARAQHVHRDIDRQHRAARRAASCSRSTTGSAAIITTPAPPRPGTTAAGPRPRPAHRGSPRAARAPRTRVRRAAAAAVRAPTIGCHDAGPVAHPGAGRPPAARRPARRRPSPPRRRPAGTGRRGSGATNAAKCGDAPRESAGRAVPVLAGQHPAAQRRPGQEAEAGAAAAGDDLALDPALQQGVLHLRRDQRRAGPAGALPARPRRRLPAGVVARCRRTGRARWRTAASSAASVSSSGVAGSQRCSCHRSTWSVPSRPSDASSAASRWPRRGVDRALGAAAATPAFVATTTSSRPTSVTSGPSDLLGLAVGVDVGGVDEGAARLDERRAAGRGPRARRCRDPRSSCPAPSRETCRPLRPSGRCSMGRDPNGRRRSAARRGCVDAPARRHRRPASVSVRRGRERDKEAAAMQLGLNLGYWGAGNDADNLALARGGRPSRLLGGVGRRGLRLGRRDRARLGRRADRAHRRRLRRSSRSPAAPRP